MQNPATPPSAETLDVLVRGEQVRLHCRTAPSAALGAAALGVVLLLVQSQVIAIVPLALWMLGLALVLIARLVQARSHRRSPPPALADHIWLRRYRLMSLAHGLVWGAASLFLFPPDDLPRQIFLVFALAAVCVGSLSSYTFDLRACGMFCALTLSALVLRLLTQVEQISLAMAFVMLMFLLYVGMVSLRASRAWRENLSLRAGEEYRIQALRRSHQQLRRGEQLAGLGSFEWEPGNRTLTWSDGHFRLWGLEPGAVTSTLEVFKAGVHPDDWPRVEAAFKAIMGGAIDDGCSYRVCWPDASVHQIHGRSEVVRDGAGKVIRMLGSVQDVTQRARIEASLADKQRMLTVMQQTTQLGFWFIDNQGHTTDVNPAMCSMLGRKRDAILGQSMFAFVPRQEWDRLRLELNGDSSARAHGYEIDLLRPDGTLVHCLNNATVIINARGKKLGLIGMFSDLTTIEQTKEALRASEFVVNSVSDMVSVTDLDGVYQLVNDAWCQRLGMARDQAIGRTLRTVLPSVLTPERERALRECIDQRQPRVVRATVTFAALGERVMETTLTPYLTRQAEVRGVVAVTRDVTEREATQTALTTSLENLRRTFNATTEGMFAYDAADPQGRLLFANDRFYEMWGIAPEQAQRTGRAEVIAAARRLFVDPDQEVARIATILAMSEPYSDRVRLRDGRVFARRSVPMKGSTGLTRVWSFRDITLEEQAIDAMRASDGQQRALMDAFPGYVSAIDQDFTYTYVNARMAGLIGQEPQKIVGRHVRDVLGQERYLQDVPEVERAAHGERVVAERVFETTPEGSRVYLQLTYVMGAKGRGGLQRYYVFGVDITELKRAEDALRAAKEEAEHANLAKSAFLASVSHELRTPLNAILGFSQLMRVDPQMSSASGDSAGEIERAGQHLLALVDDLIDLGGVEAGHLELTMARVPVETVINESLSMVAPLAANQGIRIVYTGGDARNAMVHADAVRLRQIIINLLSNAIKYNRPEGSVRVRCDRRQDSGGKSNAVVRIAVSDTGFGISADRGNRIFSAFERLGAERGAVEGTGIGLAISKRLVSAMGGAIGYESHPDEGSTFWVDLALARSTAAGTWAGLTTTAVQPLLHKTRPRILVAEDYAPNQMVLKLQLTSLGCEVEVVSDGAQALTRWAAGGYDLILSDLDMPAMNGRELARLVRQREQAVGGHVPIIAVSAAALDSERQRCLDAGMDDMLTKPILIDGLAALLQRWLGVDAPLPRGAPRVAKPVPPQGDEAVLDLDALYRALGRVSTEQARTLLATFLSSASAGLKELPGHSGQPAVLAREMHRQLSSALTVGALRYAAHVRFLEQHARAERPIDLAHWLPRMEAELMLVRHEAAALEQLDLMSAPMPLEPEPDLVGDGLFHSVLVVDDDPVVLLQMQQLLAGLGVPDVSSARNGLEAIMQLSQRSMPIEVVVCDLNMPEMDGVEMIRRFGQIRFRGGLILMSGADEQLMTTVGNLAELQGLRVLGRIQKPATPGVLRNLLRASAQVLSERQPQGDGSVMTPQAIRDGLVAREFSIWLQPKVDASTLQAVGVEALARWRQADGSYVPPDLFIVVAERAGIIGELSGVLLSKALQEGARLHAAGFPLKIALNLSALWLDDLNLPDLMLRSARAVSLAPSDIILEVTETGVTKDLTVALDVLTRLRLKGFGLSIDDFGIGYSSFEQLGRIPFTEMKLDRSFVKRAPQDGAARAMLESSMAMAAQLKLTTVAEGVETEEELALVRGMGFDSVQGNLIAAPMPADELISWLRQRQA